MKVTNQLLIVLTILLMSNLISIGCADPFVPKGTIGLEPTSPLIDVESPIENQTFEKESFIWLNFSVTKPITTWNYAESQFTSREERAHTFGSISRVSYSLDGIVCDMTGKQTYEREREALLYYSIPCGQLSEGWHIISIFAEGAGLYGELEGDVYSGSNYSMNSLPSKSVSSTVRINFVVGEANNSSKSQVLPDVYPKITVNILQNSTYNTNTIILNFSASSTWDIYPIYYSLDGLDKVMVDNTSVISQEEGNPGKNPSINRTTVEGSVVLSNLTQGWHNVTLYMVFERGSCDFLIPREYKAGDILTSENLGFFVDTSPNPFLIATSLTVLILFTSSLAIYLRRRRMLTSKQSFPYKL
jgi:hypothetical protein